MRNRAKQTGFPASRAFLAFGLAALLFVAAMPIAIGGPTDAVVQVEITVEAYATVTAARDLEMDVLPGDFGKEELVSDTVDVTVATNTNVLLWVPRKVTLTYVESNPKEYEVTIVTEVYGPSAGKGPEFWTVELGPGSHPGPDEELRVGCRIEEEWSADDIAGTYTGTIELLVTAQ